MDKPIRIAQVMGKMMNGGVESVVMNYYRHIDRTKVQFDFFADEDSSLPQRAEIESLGGRIYVVPPYQQIGDYIKKLIALFRENNYKIVHSHLNTLSVFPLYAAKKAGVPVRIAHNHSTAGKGETKKNIMKYMLRPFAKVNATHYAACSRYAGEWFFGKKSMEKGEVTIFNNAIDLDKFRYNEKVRNEVRKELGLEGKFVVGHVGRFCYQKNHSFLIDVFDEICRKNPNAMLILAGTGELLDEVKQKTSSLNLDNKVLFLGNRSDVERLYQAMDVFVLPSRYEGLPVVGVEAQAAGLACVLSDAMTKETKLLDSTIMLGLEDGAGMWCEHILAQKRIRTSDIRKNMEIFDISKQAVRLTEYYENI